jgi:hypothetical protein
MLGIFPAIPKMNRRGHAAHAAASRTRVVALDAGERAERRDELLRRVAGVADREGDEQLGGARQAVLAPPVVGGAGGKSRVAQAPRERDLDAGGSVGPRRFPCARQISRRTRRAMTSGGGRARRRGPAAGVEGRGGAPVKSEWRTPGASPLSGLSRRRHPRRVIAGDDVRGSGRHGGRPRTRARAALAGEVAGARPAARQDGYSADGARASWRRGAGAGSSAAADGCARLIASSSGDHTSSRTRGSLRRRRD